MKKIIFDLLFYLALILMVATSLHISGKSGRGPRTFAGFSAFVVLTGSMEDVIPKGSLVVTKSVDPLELEIGDDITYMVNESTTVTHRIISIEESYLGTGERAFCTKGVMNKEPDLNLVAAVNVVGKVIYHNKPLGTIFRYGQENWPLIVFFLCVILFFIKTVEFILKKDENIENEKLLEHGSTLEVIEEKVKSKGHIIEDEDGFALEIIEL